MKASNLIHYECEICGEIYASAHEALACEGKPVSQDKGAKVGDFVRITQGQGIGETAVVETTFVFSREWGHYRWKRYWHTVGLTVRLVNSWGSRTLTFDSYEVIE